jgi:plasmid maintenance system antidote protein VapI
MDADEMSEILREIGWEPAELARRLDVRQDTVRRWLSGRREIPPNLAAWLRLHRTVQAQVPLLPDNWRPGE